MAAERERRVNAGRNISKLIEQEITGDEFYQTAYGGFEEASEDEEYQTEDEDDDVVDSDFDFSEKEEESGNEEEKMEPKPKKKKWIKPVIKSKPKVKATQKKTIEIYSNSLEPRALRKSTLDLAREREKSRVEDERKRKKTLSKLSSTTKLTQRMTQEQLLEEAKLTEIENLASLEAYTRLEAEKRSFKEKKRSVEGPLIRYHSVTMPVLNSTQDDSTEKYSRNFLVFTDTCSFPDSYFPSVRPQRPKRIYCKISGLPAKYIDPLTNIPYATPHAFRMIRNRFVKEKEEKCEERLLQLSNWLEEKKRLKKQSHH